MSNVLPEDLRIPVRNEVTVLPADDPRRRVIGLPLVIEHLGVPIMRIRPRGGLSPFEGEDSLGVGQEVLVPSMFQEGYIPMVAQMNEDGSLVAKTQSGQTLAILKYESERKCWTCVGLVNLRGLKKLQLSSTD